MRMKVPTVASAAIALLLSVAPAAADDTRLPKLNMLGIRLGDSPSSVEAKLKDNPVRFDVTRREGTLRSGSFSSPQFLFGLVGSSPASQDFVSVGFSPGTSQSVIYMDRRVTFRERPTVQSIIDAFSEEFGRPPVMVSGRIYWSTSEMANKNPSTWQTCENAVLGAAGMMDGIFGFASSIDRACGITLFLTINTGQNPDLAAGISYKVSDTESAIDSSRALAKFLADGDAALKRQQLETAKTVKAPPL